MRSRFILGFFLLCECFFYELANGAEGAWLQAQLSFGDPASGSARNEKIVPGTPIQLKAKVKNMGNEASTQGSIYVRFVFAEPLNTHQKSLLFQTENMDLPSLQPEEEVEIAFKTPHHWPSFFDYIREDWPMRHYEAVAVFEEEEAVIGRIGVSISAHYTQGIVNPLPKEVPAAD